MTFQEKLEFEKKCIPDLGPVVVGHDFIVELIARYEKLRSALENIKYDVVRIIGADYDSGQIECCIEMIHDKTTTALREDNNS